MRQKTLNIAQSLSKTATVKPFQLWIVGDTPLISHAWSKKNRDEMLGKQIGVVKPGKEPRDPEQDFLDSLYDMGNGTFGFPATGIKNALVAAAHKDKGITKTTTQQALWINGDMTRLRPALAGAICDMPLVRIYGSDPEMREDPVRIGGMSKTATLSYRGQFTIWAMRITGRLNESILPAASLAFLVQEAGLAYGIGDWRNERSGSFGAFHLAAAAEEKAWEKYAAGKGKMPMPTAFAEAAE